MTHFVDAFGSKNRYPKLNLDHVVKLRPSETKGISDTAWDCLDRNDHVIGIISGRDIPTTHAVVPNITTTTLVQFELTSEDDKLWIRRYFILAWCVEGKITTPVICEYLRNDAVWCYEQHIGDHTEWIFPEHARCQTFEDAKEVATELLQESRERLQARFKPKDVAEAAG